MDSDLTLKTADYLVAAFVLAVPVAIGIFFFVSDFKKATRDEYLLGGRQMSMLPVTLSIFATFMSAVAIVGVPMDVYSHGPMMATNFIGYGIGYLLAAFTMVPLLHPLHLTSLYEYLEMRFKSKWVRTWAVINGMLQTLSYMAISMLSAALGLQTALDVPLWLSVAITGSLGTIYTTIGGIKSVVWTDFFQAVIMITCVLAMTIKGSLEVGSSQLVWNLAEAGGRTSFDHFSPDPRERLTWWGTLIGGTMHWYSTICNQASTQRICAVKNMKSAKYAFLINSMLIVVYGGILFAVGIVAYAYFAHIRCDPWQTGHMKLRNQLIPLYFLYVFRDTPGMSGLCVSALLCGTLSTVSSGINSLAANTVEDFLSAPLKKVKESRATLVTKIISCCYGILIIALALGANSLRGSVAQMVIAVLGACAGPLLGILLLGAAFAWTNKYGALTGGIIAFVINMWLAMGGHLYGKKDKALPPPPSDMCMRNQSLNTRLMQNETSDVLPAPTSGYQLVNTSTSSPDPYSYGFFLYDISFVWYGFIGTSISLMLGLFVSCLFHRHSHKPDTSLLFPWVTKLSSRSKSSHKKTTLDAAENLQLTHGDQDQADSSCQQESQIL